LIHKARITPKSFIYSEKDNLDFLEKKII